MTEPKTHRTRSGRILTDEEINALASGVDETDYEINALKTRRRGRPSMGSAQADVVPVRIDPELRAAIEAPRPRPSTPPPARSSARRSADSSRSPDRDQLSPIARPQTSTPVRTRRRNALTGGFRSQGCTPIHARSLRDAEAAGSSPAVPTTKVLVRGLGTGFGPAPRSFHPAFIPRFLPSKPCFQTASTKPGFRTSDIMPVPERI